MAGRGGGARVPRPMYEPINTSQPTNEERELDTKLDECMRETVPLMSTQDLRRREVVLGKLSTIFLQWVTDSALESGLAEEISKSAGGKIHTSGSYRLRIHEPGSDIDAICVAPKHCTRERFFSGLKEKLLQEPLVSNINAIETAAVPIITFDFDEINIDLGLACLPLTTLPRTLDIDNDQILDGVPNYDSFLPAVRCVRKWAKARGLYSNKMGYLGGVNFNIMVAFACQV
ncbi:unnamed protein product, partial [Choristocarpus tenellus]